MAKRTKKCDLCKRSFKYEKNLANHVRQVHETEQPEPEKPEPPAADVIEVHSEAEAGAEAVAAEAEANTPEAASTAPIVTTEDVLLNSKFAQELFRIIAGLSDRIRDLEDKLEHSRPQSPFAPQTPHHQPQVETPDHSEQQRQQVHQQQQEQRKQQHQIWLQQLHHQQQQQQNLQQQQQMQQQQQRQEQQQQQYFNVQRSRSSSAGLQSSRLVFYDAGALRKEAIKEQSTGHTLRGPTRPNKWNVFGKGH